MVRLRAALAALLLGAPIVSVAQDALWIRTCRVHGGPGAGEGSRIVVQDGRVADVGPDVARPAFSTEVDAHALHVTAGFVVPMTRLAMPPPPPPPPGDALRIDMRPEAKASDDALFRDDALRALLLSGITAIGVLPVSTEAGIPGNASALSTLGGTKAGTVIAEQPALVVNVATPQPWRKQVAAAFEKADASRRERQSSKDEAGGDAEPLVQCLLKKRPVLLLATTPAELQAARDAMPLQRMDVSVLDGTDLWWLAKDLHASEQSMRVLTFPSLVRQRGTRHPINRAAEWNAAGVTVAFVLPDDSTFGAQRLRDAVIELVRTGLPREKALAALTSEAAAALGVADQCGAIEKGHRADLLFWSGDPLEPTSRLERIMVGGRFIDMPQDAQP